MVNEIFSPWEWIDAWESVRQDISKVTEQDIKRVMRFCKAKQVQDEIKKQKQQTTILLNFIISINHKNKN